MGVDGISISMGVVEKEPLVIAVDGFMIIDKQSKGKKHSNLYLTKKR